MIISEDFLQKHARADQISLYGLSESTIIKDNAVLAHSEMRADGKKEKSYDIFLSHSSLDKIKVLALVDLFNKAGFSVYVDWIEDTQLDRNNVTVDTAKILRQRMNSSMGLAYVSTSNIAKSKWCPWELGYFDGKKKSRCAILPIMDSEFKGQEYLGLYPFIDYEKNQGKNTYNFWVNDPNNKQVYVSLKQWLGGTDPYKHE